LALVALCLDYSCLDDLIVSYELMNALSTVVFFTKMCFK